MRALITGGGGQLASDLQAILGDDATSYSHAELDIADSAQLDRAFEETKPDVVFNCGAFHNVDVCETEPDQAWAVNVRAVKDLAQQGLQVGGELTAAPGDQRPHRTVWNWSSRGLTSASSSSHRML